MPVVLQGLSLCGAARRRCNLGQASIVGTGLLRYARNDTRRRGKNMAEPTDDQDDWDAGARNALRLIGPDPQNWVPERAGPDGRTIDHNVAIIGGGQSGCA